MVIARHTVYSYIFQKKRFFLLFWAFDNKKKEKRGDQEISITVYHQIKGQLVLKKKKV